MNEFCPPVGAPHVRVKVQCAVERGVAKEAQEVVYGLVEGDAHHRLGQAVLDDLGIPADPGNN